MEPDTKFYPYPKTPHLAGSAVVDDDQVVGFSALIGIFNHDTTIERIVVQEKVDGSNVSVHFEEEWSPIVQKRSGLVQNDDQEQYQQFRKWVYNNLEALWEILGTSHVLFGEWLWARHSVFYDSLPAYFIAFDLLDKSEDRYEPFHTLVSKLSPHGIPIVPLVKSFDRSDILNSQAFSEAHVKTFLTSRSSFSTKEVQEGVYLRCESSNAVKYRCKLRRGDFVAGRDDFRTKTVNNQVSTKK